MPNWCNNNVTITGPADKIRAIWERAQTANVYTTIKDGEEVTETGFGLLEAMTPLGEWEYEKCVNQWGTKWDVSDEGLELSEDGTEISGWFESAWAPPTTAMATFLEANTDCEVFLAYHEPGMDFAGIFTGSNGVCEDEELSDIYNEYKSESKSDLYQRIDEEFDITGWYDSMEEDEDEEV